MVVRSGVMRNASASYNRVPNLSYLRLHKLLSLVMTAAVSILTISSWLHIILIHSGDLHPATREMICLTGLEHRQTEGCSRLHYITLALIGVWEKKQPRGCCAALRPLCRIEDDMTVPDTQRPGQVNPHDVSHQSYRSIPA